MSIFSRGSKKRKKFVKDKIKRTNATTRENYTETEANEEYMQNKEKWATQLITGLKMYCQVLCDPKAVWKSKRRDLDNDNGNTVFWRHQIEITKKINEIMNSKAYKNVTKGGSSSKYLQNVNNALGIVMATNYTLCTDPENFTASIQSCGKGLSKLKHPIGSTALVKVGKTRERIVDYVDELARLMLNKSVQENASIMVKLDSYEEWPADNKNYKYQAMTTKYVSLES